MDILLSGDAAFSEYPPAAESACQALCSDQTPFFIAQFVAHSMSSKPLILLSIKSFMFFLVVTQVVRTIEVYHIYKQFKSTCGLVSAPCTYSHPNNKRGI